PPCPPGAPVASPASAHGPMPKKYLTEPPPGTVVPDSTRHAVPAAPPVPAGVPTTDVRPLRQLAASATAVVIADVSRSEVYDEDRLRLHRLRVARVLRGRLDVVEPGIVEVRGASR